jgi:hypothetical protein
MKHRIALALPLLALACGPSVSGTYSGKGTGFLEKIEFRDDEKVELTFMGMTKEATYEIDEDRVKINNGGEITILKITDDDCLEGGGIIGRYCKEGGGDSSSRDDGFSGSKFATGGPDGGITLEFLNDERVRTSFDGESAEGAYAVDGGQITLSAPNGEEIVLRQRGSDLEGDLGGATIVFRRQ